MPLLPTSALDPLVMLATGVHSQPGVYALLLGSGVSTAAGIPTGWGVVTELVRRAAAALAPQDADAADRAAEDPEAWWAEHGDGQPLGYSNLLASLAPTPAARRAQLTGFFEPSEEQVADGLKTPSAAHRSIARLMKRGLIRVVITTNFDRLLERALEDAGLPPQVVSRPEAVAGMTSLTHAPATIIKIHGDYADPTMRNTVDELDTYPDEWTTLLRRVFDEYGLLISGWSADWDKALRHAIEGTGVRRYPLYWDSRSSKGEAASRLLAQHAGVVVPSASADELFSGLLDRVEALDRLAEPPLTTALAVARLKRYLPDPVRRIDLHDLVVGAARRTSDALRQLPQYKEGLDASGLEDFADRLRAEVQPLIALATTGVYFDQGRDHTDLWVTALQDVLSARSRPMGGQPYQQVLDEIRHLPALLLMRATGLIAVHRDRDDVLLRLLKEPTWTSTDHGHIPLPAVLALYEHKVVDEGWLRQFPRWSGGRWSYTYSAWLRDILRDPLRDLIPDDDAYRWTNDRYEYRVNLVRYTFEEGRGGLGMTPGLFLGERSWTWGEDPQPLAERDFQATADQAGDTWPWWQVLGGRGLGGLPQALADVRLRLVEMRRRQ